LNKISSDVVSHCLKCVDKISKQKSTITVPIEPSDPVSYIFILKLSCAVEVKQECTKIIGGNFSVGELIDCTED